MNYQTVLSVGVGIALAVAMGNAFIKATSSQFANDPAKNAYKSSNVREQSSQKAEDTAERQRRMMENLKSRAERNKR